MRLVGLTGGIASGKSTVARMLVDLGARLVDADRLARQVVEPDKPAWSEIVAHYGEQVLNPDRSLNREQLGEIIFHNPEERRRLNRITHPRIGIEMRELIERHRREGAELVVIDAALLLESAATNWIRPVVVVTANEEVRLERIMRRDGLSREQAVARIQAQMSEAERIARADYVIDNSGTLEQLQEQVKKVWNRLLSAESDSGGRAHAGSGRGLGMMAERRKGERRKAERRSGPDRRKKARGTPERRQGERRQGERRKKA